jgi:hypothetical protein
VTAADFSPYGVVLLGAAATAVIGGALSLFWNAVRRRRESDLASREAFYTAYAEFFTTWKLWNAHKEHVVTAPPDVQWQLLEKAEEAEATFEALLVKVTSEKKLDDVECDRLAGFRQGYQSLRECIRADEELKWYAEDIHPGHGYAEYHAFKILAGHFAALLVRRPRTFGGIPRRQPTIRQAVNALIQATRNRKDYVSIAKPLDPRHARTEP